jgi:hypothetical protein
MMRPVLLLVVSSTACLDAAKYTPVTCPGMALNLASTASVAADGNDLLLVDLNADGSDDAVVFGSGHVSLHPSQADGRFEAADGAQPMGASNLYVVAGDLNGDGRTDLFLLGPRDAPCAPRILVNGGNFQFTAVDATIVGPSLTSCATPADFTSDGLADLTARSADGNASLLVGDGNGLFTAVSTSNVSRPLGSWALAADLNGDNLQDLIIDTQDAAALHLGRGGGHFSAGTPLAAPPDAAAGLPVAGIYDFNGDTRPDLYLDDGTRAYVALGQGDGTFGAAVAAGKGYGLASGRAFGFFDMNHDGLVDTYNVGWQAAGSGSSSAVATLTLSSDGAYLTSGYVLTTLGPIRRGIALGDVNGDHLGDIVYLAEGTHQIMSRLGAACH